MEYVDNILTFNAFATTTLAVVVLFLGRKLILMSSLLKNFTIPEPVAGGMLMSFIFMLIYLVSGIEINFDMQARDVLILYFFTTIGINANFKDMIQGGKPLILLLFLTIFYIALQDSVGLLTAYSINTDNMALGVVGSSISLIGGHGTAIAWAPILEEKYHLKSAMELGLASATFGIILASIIGGPIAKFLINRHSLKAHVPNRSDYMLIGIEDDRKDEKIMSFYDFLKSLLAIHVSIIIGYLLHVYVTDLGITLPLFVTCLVAAIVLTNTVPLIFKTVPWPRHENYATALIAEVTLGLFLAMSLMNMQLWTLTDLAGPMLFILVMQLIVAVSYVLFVVFPVMGKNYDAAVISAGFGGISLGATPTAIMNMTAVTEKYGNAKMPFIVLPLVSAFFTDLFNVVSIQTALSFIG
jgi:ESS family glutamate:Na+ symporter